MPSFQEISPERLIRLVGTPTCPVLIDVRSAEDFTANPWLVPGSSRRDARDRTWINNQKIGSAIVICHSGGAVSHGVSALLRVEGIQAEVLEGGFAAWQAQGFPCISSAMIPKRDHRGRSVWVTRSRPKVDRIACPWLIRRFVDRDAVFLFVAPSEVQEVAERFNAAPFDIEADTFWSHRGELCTFDVMIQEFGLNSTALQQLATIVRAADTARLDLAPEAAGLLAASLGLSRMFANDLEQLEAGMSLYDAFYRWCRDATGETHNWPGRKGA